MISCCNGTDAATIDMLLIERYIRHARTTCTRRKIDGDRLARQESGLSKTEPSLFCVGVGNWTATTATKTKVPISATRDLNSTASTRMPRNIGYVASG
jgi:hypothetical protein